MKAFLSSKWFLLIAITIPGFILDWYTKFLAATNLRLGHPFNLIGEYAQLLLVYNKAALFGLDPRKIIPGFPLNGFFFVFTLFAIVLIVLYIKTLKKDDVLTTWGISLVMPGALGNLFDRILHPEMGVVDFIRVGISQTVYWPVFNMADVYVTIGVILICINFYLEDKKQAAQKKHAPSSTIGQ